MVIQSTTRDHFLNFNGIKRAYIQAFYVWNIVSEFSHDADRHSI